PPTPPAFDLSAEFTHPDKAIMDVLSDFVEKNRGSPHYPNLLSKLLASARLRELGVGFNVIPIPDKQEWKASWHEEGKPNWLGTILTAADGRPKLSYTASVTGCIEKDGGKGGYGVVLFDHFGRPKVASVGVSLKGKLPLIYYEFQGVRSALQLAFDHGFGDEIKLYCNSVAVRNILNLCLELTCCTPVCMGEVGRWNGHKLCTACAGLLLYGHRVMEDDFNLLFPVISDILDLFYKVNNFKTVNVRPCSGSDHLARYFSISTTQKKIDWFGLLVDEFELYEMVMKPNEIPEEVVDTVYDEVFTGDRVHSSLIMVEERSKVNEYTHPKLLYRKLRKFGTHSILPKNFEEIVRDSGTVSPWYY
ncbi:hypothetical protein MKW92_052647, partial [Papaver armeniacum]